MPEPFWFFELLCFLSDKAINVFFLFVFTGTRSQCWDRVCGGRASNCHVLREAKYACEYPDWEMGTWHFWDQELLWKKGRDSAVLPGGEDRCVILRVHCCWGVGFEFSQSVAKQPFRRASRVWLALLPGLSRCVTAQEEQGGRCSGI